jgi:hypothetical protein
MATFEVALRDGTTEVIRDADTYEQEGPLTTFFRTAPDRQVIDCWSVRLASIRTADITLVRRLVEEAVAAALGPRRVEAA